MNKTKYNKINILNSENFTKLLTNNFCKTKNNDNEFKFTNFSKMKYSIISAYNNSYTYVRIRSRTQRV